MTPSKRDGNQLTGAAKLAYKPVGLVSGIVGGLVASQLFALVWKHVSDEPETPEPLSDEYSTREVLIAAALQGAIFGLVHTAVNRYGMKAFRRFLDKPRPPSDRLAA